MSKAALESTEKVKHILKQKMLNILVLRDKIKATLESHCKTTSALMDKVLPNKPKASIIASIPRVRNNNNNNNKNKPKSSRKQSSSGRRKGPRGRKNLLPFSNQNLFY